MSTNTTNTTTSTKAPTRPACYKKTAWEKVTFSAYLDLINIVQRSLSITEFLTNHKALFVNCGIPCDESHLLSLVIAMAKDTTKDGEKVRKINPIGSLRQFFNRTWAEKDALEVVYIAPSDPNAKKPSKKSPKKSKEEVAKEYFGSMTKEEKAAFIAKLMGEVAA